MVEFEQAIVQVLVITAVEALVISAVILAVLHVSKVLLSHMLTKLCIVGGGTVQVAAHRDTVLELGETIGTGRRAPKQRILTEAEAEPEHAIN
ncbi:hypothetical protein AYO44_00115 [Planctomycetaceae bacterium SCGC AG-212-F19]|nr:hypothetical protein AYO44_00115 [Planctomycetaceae bacterium SCGC AG-212-F19]